MMRRQNFPRRISILLLLAAICLAQAPAGTLAQKQKSIVSEKSVRQHMQALASDEMRGRGSASEDELTAAKYIASQLKLLKIKPAGDEGTFLQTVKFKRRVRGAPDKPPTDATTTNVIGILQG
ncbi:MAG: hypothetical protein ACXW3C_16255, partial [Pyrinomonadaceae bacterium]